MRRYKLTTLILLFVAMLFVSNVTFAQDDVDIDIQSLQRSGEGTWSPSRNSDTAMRNAPGITEDVMFEKYTVEVLLSEPLDIEWMKFWSKADSVAGTTERFCKVRNKRTGKCVRYEDIIIKTGTKVRFDPNDMSRGIVEGCLNEFKISFRYQVTKVVAKVRPTPEPEPMCPNKPNLSLEDARELGYEIIDGRCVKPVAAVPVATPEPTVEPTPCPGCPKGIKLRDKTSSKERWTGGKTGALISCAGGYAMAKGTGNSWLGSLLKGCAPSVGVQRIQQAANPSRNILVAEIPEYGTFNVPKGKDLNSADGRLKITWEGPTAVLTFDGEECKTHTLGKTSNIAMIGIPKRKSAPPSAQDVARKTVTIKPNPRTGSAATTATNRTPGGGVPISNAPGTTVTTRAQNPNRDGISGNGQVVTIGGVAVPRRN